MADYIPRSDAEFNAWVANFMTRLASRQDALGISVETMASLQTLRGDWQNAFQEYQQATAIADAATQDKKAARESFEEALRSLISHLQTNPDMTDADRAALNIPIRATTRTPAPTPTTRPVAQIDTSQRLRHTINFADEATPNRRAKPDGARGCEIWVRVGDAPSDPQQLTFLALDTASPYVAEYTGADAGKTAHYMLRWVNSRDEKGPWSLTFSAAILG